jgi:hypothetical protein
MNSDKYSPSKVAPAEVALAGSSELGRVGRSRERARNLISCLFCSSRPRNLQFARHSSPNIGR